MHGIAEITIKGKKEQLKFNNFSTAELEKYFIPQGGGDLTQFDLNVAIAERWEQNPMLLMKNLVWAGLVGHYYVKQDFCPYTKEEIAEFVANGSKEELLPIFQIWFKANTDPEPEPEPEEEPAETEKKK